MGGAQAQAQANHQAKIADRNAALTAEQTRDATDRGNLAQVQLARKYSQRKGQQRASLWVRCSHRLKRQA
jgi:hypothetical protein